MDYEAVKEQWGEVEDRDGVRLSWNVFPSSRMVLALSLMNFTVAHGSTGSVEISCTYRRSVHSAEREARNTSAPIRACNMQAAMSFSSQPILVKHHHQLAILFCADCFD